MLVLQPFYSKLSQDLKISISTNEVELILLYCDRNLEGVERVHHKSLKSFVVYFN